MQGPCTGAEFRLFLHVKAQVTRLAQEAREAKDEDVEVRTYVGRLYIYAGSCVLLIYPERTSTYTHDRSFERGRGLHRMDNRTHFGIGTYHSATSDSQVALAYLMYWRLTLELLLHCP